MIFAWKFDVQLYSYFNVDIISNGKREMKIKICIALITVLFWVSLTAIASANVIDFENAPNVGSPAITSFSSGGFTFTSSHEHTVPDTESCWAGGCVKNGTKYLLTEVASGSPITMTHNFGLPFSLISFDAAEVFLNASRAAELGEPNANQIDLLGTLLGGGNVSTSFILDGFADGSGGGADFQNFSVGWSNLLSVAFSGILDTGGYGGFSLDNINAEPVPEPTTMLLLGTGLVGVAGAARRRKRNQA